MGKLHSLLLASAVPFVLSACAGDALFEARDGVNRVNTAVTKIAEDADKRPVQRGRIIEREGIALGGVRVPLRHGDPLPANLGALDYTVAAGMTLESAAESFSAQVGYPIAVIDGKDIRVAPATYKGSIEETLDVLAARHGLRWQNSGSTIVISGIDAELVQVPVRRQLDMGSTPSCGNSGSAQSLRSQSATGRPIDVYADIQSMATPYDGVKITTHPTVGLIKITGPSGTAKLARQLVEDRVKLLNQQLMVTLRLISVDVTNSRDFQSRFDVAFGDFINGQPAIFGFDISNGGRAEIARGLPSGVRANTVSGLISSLAKIGTIADNQRLDYLLRSGGVEQVCDRSTRYFVEQIAPPQISSSTNVTVNQVPSITQKQLELGMIGQIGAYPINQSKISLRFSLMNEALVTIEREEAANGFRVQQPVTTKRLFSRDIDVTSADPVYAGSYVTEAYTDSGSGLIYGSLPLPGEKTASARKILVLIVASATLQRSNPALIRNDPALRNPLSTVE
jgi:hypothetical protein